MKSKRLVVPLLAVVMMALVSTELQAQTSRNSSSRSKMNLEWRKTDTSLALLNRNKVVWQHVHDKEIGKPFMRIAMIDVSFEYHRPDESPVLHEHRVIRVGKPQESGTYLIDWRAKFSVSGKKDVVFGQNSHGGLVLRFAAEFCGDKLATVPAWTFFKSDGEVAGTTHSARWMAYQGTTQNGKPATVAVFAHPDNARYPAWWQTRDHYPYLNPSFTCKKDYTLRAGETLSLRNGVQVHHGLEDRDEIEQSFKTFLTGERSHTKNGHSIPLEL